jgi:hypothetical protein
VEIVGEVETKLRAFLEEVAVAEDEDSGVRYADVAMAMSIDGADGSERCARARFAWKRLHGLLRNVWPSHWWV